MIGPRRRAMASQRQPHVHVDADGVRTTTSSRVRPGVWALVAVAALVSIGLLLSLRRPVDTQARQEVRHSAGSLPEDGGDPAKLVRAQLPPPARVQLPERAEGEISPPDLDAAAETDDASADEPTGIALFPPPGTDPIKRGLVVPDDFELPPGYLRHYQVTDDGKPLPPILLFHPDFAPLDQHGEPIALPADRVVPPEMAPPGLPIELLDVPESSVPMIEEPGDAAAHAPDSQP
jgi:hypothetical protein